MKEKHCWLFYLHSDKIPEKQRNFVNDIAHGALYAYALDKPFAKKFKEQRNFKYFYCRKLKKTERLVCLLTEKFQGGILSERSFPTKIFDSELVPAKVVVTDVEYHFIFNTILSYQYRPNTMFPNIPLEWFPDIRVFKKKYQAILKTLHYDYFRLCLNGDLLLLDDDSLFKFDYLQVFLNYFGILMSNQIE